MKLKQFLTSTLIFCCLSFSVYGQQETYYGTVYGPDNLPLSGVTVNAKGTDILVRSNDTGFYKIEVPVSVLTLIFEHPKMKSSSITIGLFEVIDIHMVNLDSEEMPELSLEDLMNIQINVASTTSEDILSTGSTVTIIDKKTIEMYQFESVQEALQTVSGIDIMRTYLKRNLPTSRGVLQDNYANKVLVMINSVPVWHAVTGEGCLDRINIHDVERIEILKGPASVLYGTNAYSGAVNIVLTEETGYTNSTYLKAGSNGLLGAGSHIQLKKQNRSLFLGANIESSPGNKYTFIDEIDSVNTIHEYLNTKNISAIIQDEHSNLILNYYEADESYFGVTPSFSAGAGKPHNLKGFVAGFQTNYDLFSGLSLSYSFDYDQNNRDLSRSGNDNIRARIDGYRITNQMNLRYDIKQYINFEVGGNWEYLQSNFYENYYVPTDTTITDNNMKGINLNAYSTFGQINYISNKLNITIGSRFTHNELFKNNISSRATIVYKVNSLSSVKLIYGESFRAPSIFEQNFTTSSYTVVGNPNLLPETSKSIELLYLKGVDKIFLQLTTYYVWYENKIYRHLDYYVPAGDSVNIYTNGKTFTAAGLETEIKYINPGFLNGFLNFNFIAGSKGDQTGDNYNFKYVPKFMMTSGLSRSFKNLSLSAVFNMKSSTRGPVSLIEPMYKFDFNLGYTHSLAGKKIRHSLSLKNLTNSDYLIPEYVRLQTVNEIPQGYGRNLIYTLKINL